VINKLPRKIQLETWALASAGARRWSTAGNHGDSTMSISKTSFIAVMLCVNLGSSDTSASGGCEVINKSSTAMSLTFVRSGIGKPLYARESRSRVWLRLTNNTTCPIRVIGGHVHRLPEGGFTMDPNDGEETLVGYDVYDSLRRGEPEQWGGGDSYSVATIRAGTSVVFDVPTSHFMVGRGIAVPFAFEWEDGNIRGFSLRHYLYLLPEDLPAKLRGRLER
jgi:hypothetical protein